MRREGLEPSRPKAVTGSLVLRVCQFRHPRIDYFTSISTFGMLVNTFFQIFSFSPTRLLSESSIMKLATLP